VVDAFFSDAIPAHLLTAEWSAAGSFDLGPAPVLCTDDYSSLWRAKVLV